MGLRKKIVILAVVGIGGGMALYAPVALGRVELPQFVDRLRSGSSQSDSKREAILGKLARYEDRLLRGDAEAELPALSDRPSSSAGNPDPAANRAALAQNEEALISGDLPAESDLASENPAADSLNPPSASSLGVAGDEPFHVEAVADEQAASFNSSGSAMQDSNQDRLISELIKYRYRIKSLEQQLLASRNQQRLSQEGSSLPSDRAALDQDESEKIDGLNREVSRLKREAGYGAQLKKDLAAALDRIDELKSQLENGNGRIEIAQRSAAADEQEKLDLAEQNKELRAELSAKLGELNLIKQRQADNSNDRSWLQKLQNDLETARGEIAELKKQNKDLVFDREEFEQNRQVLEKRNKEVSSLSEELSRIGSQGKVIDQLKNERDKLASRVADLEQNSRSRAKLEADLEAVIKRSDTVAREKSEAENRLKQLSNEAAKSNELAAALQKDRDALKAAVLEKEQLLARVQSEAHECIATLDKKSQVTQKVPDLVKKLVETKNELLLREAELQTMNTPDPAAARHGAVQRASLAAPAPAAAAPIQPAAPVPARAVPAAPASDVMVIQITSDKANLRSGPGEEYAPVMQVERGMRLTVETQEGEWYRVITPTGNRAYVRQDVVNGSGKSQPAANPAARQSAANTVKQRPKIIADDSLMMPFEAPKPAAGSVDDEETRAFEQLKSELMSKSRPR